MIAQSAPTRPAPSPRQWWLGGCVLFVGAVAIGILDSSPRDPLSAPRSLLGGVLTPVARAGACLHGAAEGFWSALFERDALRRENEELRREIAESKLRAAIGSSREAVMAARTAIAPSLPPDTGLLDGAVLGSAPGAGRQLLWVSRGAADGVEAGMVVVGARGIVGTVHRVFQDSCLVALVGDGRSRWGAVGVESGETVVVAGAGATSTAHALFASSEMSVRPGEQFVTSGQAGSAAPGGVLIGTLREMTTNRTGELVGLVDLAEDPATCRVVFILSARQIPASPPAK